MTTVFSSLLAILAVTVAIPAAVLCAEIVLGLFGRKVFAASPQVRPARVAILVPAHNESTSITRTLADINHQRRPGDRLVVVADNCTDETAAIAAAAGAEVVERHDAERIGKGYALDQGLVHLGNAPPEVVIMVDADCRIAQNGIDQLATMCASTRRPVQALYLMIAPNGAPVGRKVAEFAWRLKNWVRPLGLAALGLPCQLMGTGMAFPWPVIRSVQIASGSIVEDLELGLDLATAGYPPLFCPSACVISEFAISDKATATQRSRWEHGHIRTIATTAPRLVKTALMHRDWQLLALALDLVVPPLSLLGLLLGFMLLTTAVVAAFGVGFIACVISAISFAGFVAAVFLAWLKYGRDVLPPRAVVSVPGYVFGKVGLYRRILLGKMTSQWIRTDRMRP